MTLNKYTHDIEERAHRAYHRRFCGALSYDQPTTNPDFYQEGGVQYVVLYNVNGVLAVYRVLKTGGLQWTEYIPQECREYWEIED